MSDPVLDIESAETFSARELFEVFYGATLLRFTSADHDVEHDGAVYTATPTARGSIVSSQLTEEAELEITLPINHALVRRWLQLGLPPQRVRVTVRRKYVPSGDVETIWVGEATSMSVGDENTEATFRVPSRGNDAMRRLLPTISTGKTCSHILYDSMCKISRAGSNPDGIPYKLVTTAVYVDGRQVRIDLSNVPADNAARAEWCVGGEVIHQLSGERMSIIAQDDQNPGISTVTVLTMQLPIVGLTNGHAIEVYAGCSHLLSGASGCVAKFDNKDNFGGFPLLVTKGTSAGTFSLRDLG